VPILVRDNERARLIALRCIGNGHHQLRKTAHVRQIDPGAAALVVEMSIGKTRTDEMSLQIYHPSAGTGEFPHLRVAANGDEAITCHRKRLCQAVCRIGGEHFPIHVNGVRGRRLGSYGQPYRAHDETQETLLTHEALAHHHRNIPLF
jgi:hypothetical protein